MIDYKQLYKKYAPIVARAGRELQEVSAQCQKRTQDSAGAPDYRTLFISLFSVSTFSVLDLRVMQRECEALYLADPEDSAPPAAKSPEQKQVVIPFAATERPE